MSGADDRCPLCGKPWIYCFCDQPRPNGPRDAVTPIDPAFYRTELCLAIDGCWYLMRDGGVIAVLPAAPEGQPVTDVIKARVWANDRLAAHGVRAGNWLNGMDLPPADSGYWVTEPWEDAAAIAVPVSEVTS